MGASSKTLRRRSRDIAEFSEALVRVLELTEPRYTASTFPTWRPRAGQEAELASRTAVADRLAGRAAFALASTGAVVDYKPPGTWQTTPVNPIGAWRTIFDAYAMFSPEMIFACCNQAIGLLDAHADDAEEHEHSLEGKLGHAFGFWHRIRGGSDLRGGRRGIRFPATVVGIPSAVLATVIAGLITNWFGWGG
jgi:hypothetical protein